MKISVIVVVMFFSNVSCLHPNQIKLATEYFSYKEAKFLCYFSCESQFRNLEVVREFARIPVRTSVKRTDGVSGVNIKKLLSQWTVGVGVMMDGSCDSNTIVLESASKRLLFDATHYWMVFISEDHPYNETIEYIERNFGNLNLSIDADIAVASREETGYKLTDVFNFGRIQGNGLEISSLGSWRPDAGLNIPLKGYKYYHRWDFHNLTLRAISVIMKPPKVFYPEMLTEVTFSPYIKDFTKITSQILKLLMEKHNFRFNYTITDRWIGSPERNSSLSVTKSLYWREQDISSTGARIFPQWLNWVDVGFPPTTYIETKFYYLMADKGVGEYENRFLNPLSPGVWWCTAAAGALCAVVLAAAACLETRPRPGLYALFCVTAAICQQGFNDGVQEERASQGRKLTLLVVGMTSMLLYNYYTSSVVSWLLSAAPPSIDSIERLRDSSLELIFEDVGYTRGWLDNPGFYYYSGFRNPKEDELREKKVTKARRTAQLMQPVTTGVQLMRTGEYAYHTDPYTMSEEVSRTFREEERCELGQLQMMPPAPIYIMVQKQSPYKEFIVWSLMRASERGHYSASHGRFPRSAWRCSGRRPRALALGQAAPAFLLLLCLTALAVLILLVEILRHNYRGPVELRQWVE